MNDVEKILAALDSLMQSKGAGEGIMRAAQLGDVTARSLVSKAARDIDKLQEMTGPKMYQAVEQAEIKALADRAGVSEEEMQGRINSDDVTPKKVNQLSKEEFYQKFPKQALSDEELFLSNILKDQKGVGKTVDEVFDNAFVYGVNKLGLSQEEAKTYASGIIGKITTPEQHTPAGPDLQAKLQQVKDTTPTPVSKGGIKMAGKYAKYIVPLLGGTSGLYLLADALSDKPSIKMMTVPTDADMDEKIAIAQQVAQAVS